MTRNKTLFLFALVTIIALALSACAGAAGPQGDTGSAGPAGDAGPAGPAGADAAVADVPSCTDCHDDTTLISAKQHEWATSGHATGSSVGYAGGRTGCEGCHSGGAFSDRVAAGAGPDEFEGGESGVTPQDCRACHAVHTSYTGEDFALETVAPVALYALDNAEFDGGSGNLCASCHQPRRAFPEAVDGMVEITSTHWGPHHGAESAMMLGLGGGGDVEGKPAMHANIEDTCVACHMGENDDHGFEPNVAACQGCHADAESFDINGFQTEIEAMLDELEEILISKGLLDEEGHPAVDTVDAADAAALWNWIYIAHEDGSRGVHNPKYTMDLLVYSLESVK